MFFIFVLPPDGDTMVCRPQLGCRPTPIPRRNSGLMGCQDVNEEDRERRCEGLDGLDGFDGFATCLPSNLRREEGGRVDGLDGLDGFPTYLTI